MAKRALITTGTDVPRHLRAWRTVGLDEKDLIIIVGEDDSPHAEINALADELAHPGGVPTKYLAPADQTGWQISEDLPKRPITVRLNVAILEALKWGAQTITIVGEHVYPMTLDFFDRTGGVLRGAAPHWLVSSGDGWWNPGSLLDPPVTLRGFPASRRHATHELKRELELEQTLRPAVLVHQMLGEPDVDAMERIVSKPEPRRYRSDTNVLLASGTWCPFTFEGAVTFTREVAPLLFVWPHVGRLGDVWASLLAQRAMEDLGRHVVFGMPLVRRDSNDVNPQEDLMEELVGLRYTDGVEETLRITTPTNPQELSAYNAFHQLTTALTRTHLFLPKELSSAFLDWRIDLSENLDLG
jgi:hypothetical protein